MISLLAACLLIAFTFLVERESARDAGQFWKAWNGRLAILILAIFLILTLRFTIGGINSLLAVLTLLLLLKGSLRTQPWLESPAFLKSRASILLVGVVSAATVGVVWGSLDPVARGLDEAAYLLQARIFASGRWTAPARPLPEFFEQMQVFVTPVLAGKYPPGHSLALVPGIWLGMPALMPVVLNGIAGSLIFLLAGQVAGAWVGLVTWLLWISAPGTMGFRASYYSENTTIVLWLLALWALREWMSSGARRWLVLLVSSVGFGAITRPMTMFALSLPIVLLFVRQTTRTRRWRDLVLGGVLGASFLAIGLVWSVQTIGEWRTTPYRYYSQVYFPYQWTGFGERQEPPLRPMPPGVEAFDQEFRSIHAHHTVRGLPNILIERVEAILDAQWEHNRQVLQRAAALLGALALSGEGAFALVSAALVVFAHLFMAQQPLWTVYYMEIEPVLSLLTATGICGALASILLFMSAPVRRRWTEVAFLGLALILTAEFVLRTVEVRGERIKDAGSMTAFRQAVERLPELKVIVFVRYGPDHDPHRSLVTNEPDLQAAKAWLVHDLGDRNARLLALAPERKPYLYDEASGSFSALGSTRDEAFKR